MFINVQQYRLENEQLANMWQLQFFDKPNLDLHIVEANLPFNKLEMQGRSYGKKSYTRMAPVETISFTFREVEGFDNYNFFNNWLNDIYDFKKHVFKTFSNELDAYIKKYKTATLMFMRKIGGHLVPVPSKTFTLNKLMILGISEISLSNDNGEPLEFTVEMAVEDVDSGIL
ncbi:MAG: hypothetical protein PF569_01680 [Candidatus Woesearchaeota archaeon]|jgi:hypothetical protein|nr:hypothetical protein [Candidatus Woesearchaeota archaeon]